MEMFMEVERVTPDRVFAAYEKCGLVPVQGEFYASSDGIQACCALSAVAIAEFKASEVELNEVGDRGDTTLAVDLIGLDYDYTQGFIAGWDTPEAEFTADVYGDEFLSGVEDGRKASIRMGIYAKES